MDCSLFEAVPREGPQGKNGGGTFRKVMLADGPLVQRVTSLSGCGGRFLDGKLNSIRHGTLEKAKPCNCCGGITKPESLPFLQYVRSKLRKCYTGEHRFGIHCLHPTPWNSKFGTEHLGENVFILVAVNPSRCNSHFGFPGFSCQLHAQCRHGLWYLDSQQTSAHSSAWLCLYWG